MDRGVAFWDACEGATFHHDGRDIPVEQGFVLLRFAKWHATVAGQSITFWASADPTEVPIPGATKDEDTETGLDLGYFDQCFSENWRCGRIYPSAPRLCEHLAQHKLCYPGKRVLELGAGSGVPGIWAKSAGCEVVLTDRLSGALELMKRSLEFSNVPESGGDVVKYLLWGQHPRWLSGFDIVLASETAYGSFDDLLLLFGTAASALKQGGDMLVGLEHRHVEFSGKLDESTDFRSLQYTTVEALVQASRDTGFELCGDLVPGALGETHIFGFVKL